MDNDLMDINIVCNMLGCTSRTLRFYEEKGIIKSTTSPFSDRRRYSNEQIQRIKEVLVLRSLGLPVSKIKELQNNSIDLIDAIAERKADLIASMTAKAREYNLLSEALLTLNAGGDIFKEQEKSNTEWDNGYIVIVNNFTDYFINELYDWCFDCFSQNLKDYLPLSAFKKVILDTLKPIGGFVKKEKTEKDENLNNVFYSYLKYEKLGLVIKLVFARKEIHGVWLNYYYPEEETSSLR